MHPNYDQTAGAADAGGPQRGPSEDRTAEAAAGPRGVITGANLLPPHESDETLSARPGHRGKAVPLYRPNHDPDATPEAAHIDWLAFSIRLAGLTLPSLFAEVTTITGAHVGPLLDRGWNGYTKRADLIGNLGLVAWGGKAQRDTAYVSLNAHGCAGVPDWVRLTTWLSDRHASIRRIDLAHDDFTGQTYNIDWMRAQYQGTGFTGRDGRKPRSFLIGDWDHGEKGRTYAVGSRLSGKYLRGYEKGKQLGDSESPWFRLELELLAKNRLIPLDALLHPGRYLAGAYPCLSGLDVTPASVPTQIKAAGIRYNALIEHIRRQYGQAINLVQAVEGGDAGRALEKIKRPGFPARFTPYLGQLIGGSDEDADTP